MTEPLNRSQNRVDTLIEQKFTHLNKEGHDLSSHDMHLLVILCFHQLSQLGKTLGSKNRGSHPAFMKKIEKAHKITLIDHSLVAAHIGATILAVFVANIQLGAAVNAVSGLAQKSNQGDSTMASHDLQTHKEHTSAHDQAASETSQKREQALQQFLNEAEKEHQAVRSILGASGS